MGCKFSFKRVFLVASLCFAGLFGISSVVINEQVKETQVAERAEAASDDYFSTIYITIGDDGWNCNSDGTWKTTKIWFYNNTSLKNLHDNPNASASGYLETRTLTQVPGEQYAIVNNIPASATSFMVTNANNDSAPSRTEPQLLQKQSTGLNNFIITTNYPITYRQTGYWYGFETEAPLNFIIERTGTADENANPKKNYSINYYQTVYQGNSDGYNYYQDGSLSGIEFSYTACYGGRDCSGSIDITSKPKISAFKITTTSSKEIHIPMVSDPENTYVYDISTDTWSKNLPEQIELVADVRVTTNWSGYPITADFKPVSGDNIKSNVSLSSRTIDGVDYYGTTSGIPFGTAKICLHADGYYFNRDRSYTADCTDLVEVTGENYIFLRTTTNITSGKQSVERGNPDGYYLYGSFNAWNHVNGLVKLTSNGEGGYCINNYTIIANTTLKMAKVVNNDISYDYGVGGGFFTPFPALYPLNSDGGSNFKVFTSSTYNVTMYSLHEEWGNNYCGMSIEPTNVSVQYTINDGEKHNMSRTGTNENGYLAIYSSTSAIRPNVGDVVKFYVNNTLMSTTYAEAGSNALSGSGNNISVNTDLLADQTLIFETKGTQASPEYVAYLGGYRARRTSSFTGIESDTAFYIKDSTSNGWWSGTSYTWIRFYDPINGYEDTLDEEWVSFGATTSGSYKEGSNTVPTYNGKVVYWTKADIYRCGQNKQPDPSKAKGDDNYWNSATGITISADDQNAIDIYGDDNAFFRSYDDPKAGFASGNSIYILDSNNWLSTYEHLYCYFFNDKKNNKTGDAWSAAAIEISYSNEAKGAVYYEITIPQRGSVDALWQGVIVVGRNGSAGWDNPKYQSQNIEVNSGSKAAYQLITTTSSGSATLTNSFTGQDRSDCFVEHFRTVITHSICELNGGESSNLDALKSKWSEIESDYNKMDSKANAYFTDATANPSGNYLEQAASTYDYVVNKYGKTELNDFADRDGVSISYNAISRVNPFNILVEENNSTTVIVIIASSISLLSITALSILLIKKRKPKEQ